LQVVIAKRNAQISNLHVIILISMCSRINDSWIFIYANDRSININRLEILYLPSDTMLWSALPIIGKPDGPGIRLRSRAFLP